MSCIAILRFVCLLVGVSHLAEALLKCPPSSEGNAIRRLKSSLLCDYEKYERPVKNRENAVVVNFKLLLKYISFMDYQNKYELSAYFWMSWNDEFLTWDPKDYDNIDEIWLSSNDIWVIDAASMHTDTKQMEVRGVNENSCRVSSQGKVTCAPQVNTAAYCRQKLTRWPFDQQNCTFTVISYGYMANETEFKFNGLGYKSEIAYKSNDWVVLNISKSRVTTTYYFSNKTENETYIHLEYYFQFQRHADLYAVVVIATAFVMSALTLISFWIHDMASRACLCSTSLIGNLLCLLYIATKINASGNTTPNIALFYRDAMVMTVFALMFGVFMERVRDRTTNIQAPLCLTSGASWLKQRGGRAGQLLLGDNNTEVIAKEENSNTCSIYVNFLDRLTFLILLIIYSVMLAALLP